jgi:hypothetical protein
MKTNAEWVALLEAHGIVAMIDRIRAEAKSECEEKIKRQSDVIKRLERKEAFAWTSRTREIYSSHEMAFTVQFAMRRVSELIDFIEHYRAILEASGVRIPQELLRREDDLGVKILRKK